MKLAHVNGKRIAGWAPAMEPRVAAEGDRRPAAPLPEALRRRDAARTRRRRSVRV